MIVFSFAVISMLLALQPLVQGQAILEVVTSSQDVPPPRYCVNYNNMYQHLPSSEEEALHFDLDDFSQIDGCNSSDYIGHAVTSSRAMVGVMRGRCTFVEKAVIAQDQGAAAVVVVDYKNSSVLGIPAGNRSQFAIFNISLLMISWDYYASLTAIQGKIRVKLYDPPPPVWDSNMILICLGSTTLVMIGSVWAAYTENGDLKKQRLKQNNRSGNNRGSAGDGGSKKSDDDAEDASLPFTVGIVLVWFCFIVAIILLLYFLYDYVVYFFIGVFCLVGAHSLYRCLLPFWTYVMPINYDIPLNRLPCVKSKAKLGSLLLLMPCATLAIYWAVERHSQHAWILQNILGASFCIYIMQSLRMPSLKVIGIFLCLLLIYDVFFVFITPLFTSNGESVMVSIATGDNGRSKESLPLLFIIPLLGHSPKYACRDRDFSMLGFGDVIVPGLLVAYNAVSDVRLRGCGNGSATDVGCAGRRGRACCSMIYFFTASAGYLVGMAMCMISLVLMEKGQPALLFLVPCTLIPTALVALCRREFCILYRGEFKLAVTELDGEAQVSGRRNGGDVAVQNGDSEDEEDHVMGRLPSQRHSDEHIRLIL